MVRTGFSPTLWLIVFGVIAMVMSLFMTGGAQAAVSDLLTWEGSGVEGAERRDCRSQVSTWCGQEEHAGANWADFHPNCVQYQDYIDNQGDKTTCPVQAQSTDGDGQDGDQSEQPVWNEELANQCDAADGSCFYAANGNCEERRATPISDPETCGEGTVCCQIDGGDGSPPSDGGETPPDDGGETRCGDNSACVAESRCSSGGLSDRTCARSTQVCCPRLDVKPLCRFRTDRSCSTETNDNGEPTCQVDSRYACLNPDAVCCIDSGSDEDDGSEDQIQCPSNDRCTAVLYEEENLGAQGERGDTRHLLEAPPTEDTPQVRYFSNLPEGYFVTRSIQVQKDAVCTVWVCESHVGDPIDNENCQSFSDTASDLDALGGEPIQAVVAGVAATNPSCR